MPICWSSLSLKRQPGVAPQRGRQFKLDDWFEFVLQVINRMGTGKASGTQPYFDGLLSFGVCRMTRFTWDQVDVLTCLEVEPKIDEDAVSSHYDLRRDGWRISLTIFAADRDLHLVLQRDDLKEPFFDFWMRAIGEIRYYRKDAVEELLFLSSNDPEDRPNLPFGFMLRVSPQVLIRFGDSLGAGLTSRCI